MLKLRHSKGFTLIEMLVVLLIIGLLASMVIINVSESRVRARDARRKGDIKTIQNALEMYNQKKTKYPEGATCMVSPANPNPCNISELNTELKSYISSIPSDPMHDSADPNSHPNYQYKVDNAKDAYALLVTLEENDNTTACQIGINTTDLGLPDASCIF